jgi:hypothetical protein
MDNVLKDHSRPKTIRGRSGVLKIARVSHGYIRRLTGSRTLTRRSYDHIIRKVPEYLRKSLRSCSGIAGRTRGLICRSIEVSCQPLQNVP